jgi:hypothetical protein
MNHNSTNKNQNDLFLLYEENGFSVPKNSNRLTKRISENAELEIHSNSFHWNDNWIDIWVRNKHYSYNHIEEDFQGMSCLLFRLRMDFLFCYIQEIQDYSLYVVNNRLFLNSRAMYLKRVINKTYILSNEEAHLSFTTHKNGEKKYKLKFHKEKRYFSSEFHETLRP